MSCALATFCSFLRSAKPRRKQRLSMAKWWLQAPAATPLWAAGILLLGIGPVWKWLVKGKREEDRFPKVPGLWFFGVTCEFGFNFLFHYFYPKMDQFSKQFGAEGAYELHVLGKRVVICCSWESAKEVFAYSPHVVVKSDPITAAPFMGSVGASIGHDWHRELRLMAPFFSQKPVGEATSRLRRIAEKAVTMMTVQCNHACHKSSDAGTVVDLNVLTPMVIEDLQSHFCAGAELHMNEAKSRAWSQALWVVFELSAVRSIFHWLLPLPYWKIPGLGNLDGLLTAQRNLAEATMKLNEGEGNPDNGTFVGRLKYMVQNGEMEPHHMVVTLAGFTFELHALAPFLCLALLHLSKLPDVQNSIATELEMSGARDAESKSIWAEALFLETLRFYPFEISTFETAESIVIAGRQVPQGTKIFPHMTHIMRHLKHPKLGDDPEDFRPGRWVGPDGIIDAEPVNSLAFTRGRQCVGQHLARALGIRIIGEVARTFSLKAVNQKPVEVDPITRVPVDANICVRLRKPEACQVSAKSNSVNEMTSLRGQDAQDISNL